MYSNKKKKSMFAGWTSWKEHFKKQKRDNGVIRRWLSIDAIMSTPTRTSR